MGDMKTGGCQAMVCQIEKLVHGTIESLETHVDISETARFMAERRLGSVVVTENERVIGLFTETDMIRRVIGPGKNPGAVTLEEVCTRDLVSIAHDATCIEAIRTMRANRCRRLLVYKEDRFLGIATLAMVAQSIADSDNVRNMLLNAVVGMILLVTFGIITFSVYHLPEMMRMAQVFTY